MHCWKHYCCYKKQVKYNSFAHSLTHWNLVSYWSSVQEYCWKNASKDWTRWCHFCPEIFFSVTQCAQMGFNPQDFYQRGDPHFHGQMGHKNHSLYSDFSSSGASKYLCSVWQIFLLIALKILCSDVFLKNMYEEAPEQEKYGYREWFLWPI